MLFAVSTAKRRTLKGYTRKFHPVKPLFGPRVSTKVVQTKFANAIAQGIANIIKNISIPEIPILKIQAFFSDAFELALKK